MRFLRNGMTVVLRNGRKLLFVNHNFYEFDFFAPSHSYKEDLTSHGDDNQYDIVEVYDIDDDLIWYRKDITDEEKAILKSIDKRVKYIARDKDGTLYLYEEKPEKKNSYWDVKNSDGVDFEVFSHIFKWIRWEDDEPVCIEEVLK